MTSQIIGTSAIAPTSFISFNLLNGEERNTLYLLGGAQTLTLEVTNKSNGNLSFTPSSQLILIFRPGTLVNTDNIQVEESGWDLNRSESSDDMEFSLILRPKTDLELEFKKVLKLNLSGVEADNRAGSHSSRVELKISKVLSAGHEGEVTDCALNAFQMVNGYPGANSLVETAKETADKAQNLLEQLQDTFAREEVELIKTSAYEITSLSEIVNPLFKADILNGSNTILNDGLSENRLMLRIATTSQDLIKVRADKPAKISFDFGELGEVSGPTGGRPAVEAQGWEAVNTETAIHQPEGSNFESHHLDVVLTFKCSGLAGSGRLKIHYSNLNDSDGYIYLLLYKSSLTIGANTVGVGTLPGAEKLKVKGDVAISRKLTIGKEGEDYIIEITGVSSNSGGAQTRLIISGASINIRNEVGINTVILNPDGSFKKSENHNLWSSWNNWKSWVDFSNGNAVDGDVVIVASSGAVRPVPTPAISLDARNFLSSIGAICPFKNEFEGNVSYALVFVKGQPGSAQEEFRSDGQPASLKTSRESLLSLEKTLTVKGDSTFDGTISVTSKITATAFEGVGAMVKGMIVMWSGNANQIPKGWKLCNGNDGTPDLRDRFIMGAGNDNNNASGDAETHHHVVHISGQTNVTGEHHHYTFNNFGAVATRKYGSGNGVEDFTIYNFNSAERYMYYTTAKEGNHQHGYDCQVNTTDSTSNRPKWYALCFIIKT